MIGAWWRRGCGTPPAVHLIYCSAILATWVLSAVFNGAPQHDEIWPGVGCTLWADGRAGCIAEVAPWSPPPAFVEPADARRCQRIPEVSGCAAAAWPDGVHGRPATGVGAFPGQGR